MNNPWYNAANGMPQAQQPTGMSMPNPMGIAGEVAMAMRNPMAYAMQQFQDVPKELWNNPAQALQYIQQTRGISNADLQNMLSQFPLPR